MRLTPTYYIRTRLRGSCVVALFVCYSSVQVHPPVNQLYIDWAKHGGIKHRETIYHYQYWLYDLTMTTCDCCIILKAEMINDSHICVSVTE